MGLDEMKTRIEYYGKSNEGRLVTKKKMTFDRAIKNSYQSEWITVGLTDEEIEEKGEVESANWECLINPSKLTEDYDTKILSIDFDSGIKEGDVFYWNRTKEHWMVLLQQHTEEAYFRGTCKRCDYTVEINNTKYWVVEHGPSQTNEVWFQEHSESYDNTLNYTMMFKIAKNKDTMDFCDRNQIMKYQVYYYNDAGERVSETHRWQIVATDKYSSDRTIDVFIKEYYDNELEDKKVTPVEPPYNPPTEGNYIEGDEWVDAFSTGVAYKTHVASAGTFSISAQYKSIAKIKSQDETTGSCSINILTGKKSTFDLVFNDGTTSYTRTIHVRSL